MRRVVLLVALGAYPGLAHAPGHVFPDQPFVIARPEVSYALFGEFVTGAERFVITLEHTTRFATPVELLVPHQQDLQDHRPAWAVVAAGLPAPSAAELAALPAPLPPGAGAIVDLNEVTPRPALFESVMRRFFWSSGPLAVVFPEGKSELWVWCPAKTRGKFGVGYGIEEGGGYMAAFADWGFYAY